MHYYCVIYWGAVAYGCRISVSRMCVVPVGDVQPVCEYQSFTIVDHVYFQVFGPAKVSHAFCLQKNMSMVSLQQDLIYYLEPKDLKLI